MGLTDGLVLKNPAVLLMVEGRSGKGEQLYSNNFTVTVNGTAIPAPTAQTGSLFGYDAYLRYEGANTITVTAGPTQEALDPVVRQGLKGQDRIQEEQKWKT